MCAFLITREERNNYSMASITAVCVLLMTSANLCKSAVLPLGKPLFYPLNYGN